MFDPVGSTSWHNRHLPYFHRLDALLREAHVVHPTVLIAGPGGVTRLLAPLLNDAARAGASRLRTLIGDAGRYADQLLRRIPGMPIRSLEPGELRGALSMPHRLVVVDRSRRILRSIAREFPGTECHCVDLVREAIPVQADAIVAFNVICRLDDPAAGMAHLVAALKPGGWLLMDDRSAAVHLPAGFETVAPKTHRRNSE